MSVTNSTVLPGTSVNSTAREITAIGPHAPLNSSSLGLTSAFRGSEPKLDMTAAPSLLGSIPAGATRV